MVNTRDRCPFCNDKTYIIGSTLVLEDGGAPDGYDNFVQYVGIRCEGCTELFYNLRYDYIVSTTESPKFDPFFYHDPQNSFVRLNQDGSNKTKND